MPDSYEDDEPVEKIIEAFERGETGVTGRQVAPSGRAVTPYARCSHFSIRNDALQLVWCPVCGPLPLVLVG